MTNQEINEAVARKLGWTERELPGNISPWTGKTVEGKYLVNPKTNNGESIPDYCHSIAAAWEIVEHLEKGNPILSKGPDNSSLWRFSFYDERAKMILADAESAPMAICLAFLKLP